MSQNVSTTVDLILKLTKKIKTKLRPKSKEVREERDLLEQTVAHLRTYPDYQRYISGIKKDFAYLCADIIVDVRAYIPSEDVNRLIALKGSWRDVCERSIMNQVWLNKTHLVTHGYDNDSNAFVPKHTRLNKKLMQAVKHICHTKLEKPHTFRKVAVLAPKLYDYFELIARDNKKCTIFEKQFFDQLGTNFTYVKIRYDWYIVPKSATNFLKRVVESESLHTLECELFDLEFLDQSKKFLKSGGDLRLFKGYANLTAPLAFAMFTIDLQQNRKILTKHINEIRFPISGKDLIAIRAEFPESVTFTEIFHPLINDRKTTIIYGGESLRVCAMQSSSDFPCLQK